MLGVCKDKGLGVWGFRAQGLGLGSLSGLPEYMFPEWKNPKPSYPFMI